MSIHARWRQLRGLRTCGALPEFRPQVTHPDIDRLGLPGASRSWLPVDGGWAGIALPSGARALLEVPRWTQHPVLDQKGANACVLNADMRAERSTLMGRYGLTIEQAPLGSRLYGYWFARRASRIEGVDGGCYPSVALDELSLHGVPPERMFPYKMGLVSRRPPAAARWDALQRRGVRGTYMLHDRGEARIDALRATHSSGRSVTLTLPVYRDLVLNAPTRLEWRKRGAPTGGYHHVECGGTVWGDGQWWLLCCNSWGSGVHSGGFFIADQAYAHEASSLCVIDPEEPAQ